MRHLVIDCETTGLSHCNNQVLTVGLLDAEITKNKLKIKELDHILIKHKDYNVSPMALRINKINLQEHHKKGLPLKKACKKINNFILTNKLNKVPVLGHNIGFDFRFLAALGEQAKTELEMSWNPVDTMQIWRTLRAEGRVPYQCKSNLKTLSHYFQLDYSKAHHALHDCIITSKVYHNLLRIID
jgi:DNA polymerase III alpha subunit (gram-positive type)